LSPVVKCQNCANTFYVKPSRMKHGRGKFCSIGCRNASRNRKYIVKCQCCSGEFYTSASRQKNGHGKFCSRACADKAKTLLHGPSHPLWNREQIKCAICDSIFEREPNMNAKYCSRECRDQANAQRIGSKHPLWTGGCLPYSSEWNNKLKQQIRQRDGDCCIICRMLVKGSNGCVHHIDYNKKNCRHNNLVLLCRSCHTKTNTRRKSWVAILSDVTSDMRFGGFLWM